MSICHKSSLLRFVNRAKGICSTVGMWLRVYVGTRCVCVYVTHYMTKHQCFKRTSATILLALSVRMIVELVIHRLPNEFIKTNSIIANRRNGGGTCVEFLKIYGAWILWLESIDSIIVNDCVIAINHRDVIPFQIESIVDWQAIAFVTVLVKIKIGLRIACMGVCVYAYSLRLFSLICHVQYSLVCVFVLKQSR